MTSAKTKWLAIAASACLALLPVQAAANPDIVIKLVAADGSVSLEGQLLAIEDGYYILQTSGDNEVRVQSHLINCVSAICPE